MELVSISQLQPGHVVACPVNNTEGAILCPIGYRLTEQSIARLAQAGVVAVVIEGALPKAPDLAQRLSRLEARFAGVEDPLLLQFKDIIRQRLRLLYDKQRSPSSGG